MKFVHQLPIKFFTRTVVAMIDTARGETGMCCALQPGCATHHVWMTVQSTIAKALDGMSLKDLTVKTATRESAHA